jgi:hypothetical protein
MHSGPDCGATGTLPPLLESASRVRDRSTCYGLAEFLFIKALDVLDSGDHNTAIAFENVAPLTIIRK